MKPHASCSLALSLALGAVLPLSLAACHNDDPMPPHYTYPEAGKKYDGILWPNYDLGSTADRTIYTYDTGTQYNDGQVQPADAAPDGPPDCPGPAAAKCASACATQDLCTEAKGGTCVKQLVLTGAATDKVVLKEVAEAYVRCWNKAPADNLLCYTFNTCAMTGSLTDAAICTWVCNSAGVSDFPTSADHDTAKGLCKCSMWQGQLVYRPDWKIGSVIPGKKGIVCLTYDKNPWYFDALNVNDCQYYPPP